MSRSFVGLSIVVILSCVLMEPFHASQATVRAESTVSVSTRPAAGGPIKNFLHRLRNRHTWSYEAEPTPRPMFFTSGLTIHCPNTTHNTYHQPRLSTCGTGPDGCEVIGTIIGGTMPDFAVGETKLQPIGPDSKWHVEFTNLPAAAGVTFRIEVVSPFDQLDYGTFDLTASGWDCSTECPMPQPPPKPPGDKDKDKKLSAAPAPAKAQAKPQMQIKSWLPRTLRVDGLPKFEEKGSLVVFGLLGAKEGKVYGLLIKMGGGVRPMLAMDSNPAPFLYTLRFPNPAPGTYLLRIRSEGGACIDIQNVYIP